MTIQCLGAFNLFFLFCCFELPIALTPICHNCSNKRKSLLQKLAHKTMRSKIPVNILASTSSEVKLSPTSLRYHWQGFYEVQSRILFRTKSRHSRAIAQKKFNTYSFGFECMYITPGIFP